jgi:hypothetical protein
VRWYGVWFTGPSDKQAILRPEENVKQAMILYIMNADSDKRDAIASLHMSFRPGGEERKQSGFLAGIDSRQRY